MQQETAHLPTVSDTALDNPDLTLFVDGSRFSDASGKFHTGYAVTTTDSVLEAQPLPASCSAQEAELKALTAACKLAAGKRANIFSDSRYAQGVALDFGTIWKTRGYLTATGSPIKNGRSVADLMEALTLPEQVAVLKVKAHGRLTSPEAIGNHLADTTAKEIAVAPLPDAPPLTTSTPLLQVTFLDSIDKLQACQASASTEEINGWLSKGATCKDGLYSCNKKPCIPRSLYPSLVQWAHGPTHVSKNLMNNLISKLYFAPGITTLTRNYTAACTICAQCNPGRMEKPPVLNLAKPLYPFQRIQIDHIQMPRCGRFEYVLVVVDMFSGWPEAFPVANMTAKTTAKKLLSEIVCRYGVPEVIESDQGPVFTASVTKDIWTALGVTLHFHTPYHPQSSGKVERMNGTLKTKMLKMSQDSGMLWPDSLPIALFSVRYTPRGVNNLSPFEILFGCAPRLGCYFPQTLQLQFDVLNEYVCQLSNELSKVHGQVFSSIPDPTSVEGSHSLVPGDWVLVKKFLRKSSLEPRFDGPFQVLLTTATSVKLDGKNTWIHASHCKKSAPPASPASDSDSAPDSILPASP
ncbi:protein NYNRIN-like [Xenopus laevis]|uniref:Protein NYNRIN-like n=1 Tax=Xenopus laevis TaxID=8355 RepID=A0A8J1MXL5_XENLA|nr:protein NYNRIN-like [Xenopus laevis]